VLCEKIFEKYKLQLNPAQLSKWLKKQGLVWKKVRHNALVSSTNPLKFAQEARERDEVLRNAWMRRLGQFCAEQLVFLDESGFNPRTGDVTHGWAKKGEVIRQKVPGPKGENYSLLPAMTVDGYIACNVHQGAVNMEMFRDFVEDSLLPLCTPYPGPRSVIVLDNAAIHNVQSPLFNVANGGCRTFNL